MEKVRNYCFPLKLVSEKGGGLLAFDGRRKPTAYDRAISFCNTRARAWRRGQRSPWEAGAAWHRAKRYAEPHRTGFRSVVERPVRETSRPAEHFEQSAQRWLAYPATGDLSEFGMSTLRGASRASSHPSRGRGAALLTPRVDVVGIPPNDSIAGRGSHFQRVVAEILQRIWALAPGAGSGPTEQPGWMFDSM